MQHKVIANYSWILKICYKMYYIGLTNNLQNDKMSKRNLREMQKKIYIYSIKKFCKYRFSLGKKGF